MLRLICALGVLVLWLAACAPGAFAPATPTAVRNTMTDYASLVAAFEKQGISARPGETHWDRIFSHDAHRLDLPNTTLAVLEYSSEAEAQAVMATISPEGFGVGNYMVDWVSEPHFYHVNRLIVLYVGRDQSVVNQLQQLLGPQFAGAPTPQPTPTVDPAFQRLPPPPTAPPR